MIASKVSAAVPGQVDFQGLLLDSGGQPVNGVLALTFTLYDAPTGGTQLWTESHAGVSVVEGVYDVSLGAQTPLTPALLSGGSVFLEIDVEGETLSPRRQLLAVPYALQAAESDSLSNTPGAFYRQIVDNFAFDGGDPPNSDPSEGLADADGDGVANFVDADNDGDGLSDTVELANGSDINLVTPVISAFTPANAAAAATSVISVLGANFEPGITVDFGTETPTPTNITTTSFDVVVGPQPVANAPVTVTRTSNGESATATFAFEQTLSVTGFDPPFLLSNGSGTVTVLGTGFEAGMTVEFGTQTPTPTNLTPTSFDVVVGPQAAGGAAVTVTRTSNGENASATFLFDGTRILFQVASVGNGNLGGIAGADAICAGAATNLGLPGTFLAWIADSTTSPATRFSPNGFGYRSITGTKIADDWADLTDGTLDAPVGGGGVPWTNVAIDGTSAGSNHCSDWTSASSGESGVLGNSTSTDASWTNMTTAACSFSADLYCLQQ